MRRWLVGRGLLVLRAEHVEIGGKVLRDDAGEGGVTAFGRTVGHAVQAGEHRHGEAVVVAAAGDGVFVFVDHFLMAGQRAGEQFVGEARAGDEDGRVPAEAKGRSVAADAQGIGGAGGDVDGVAGRGDDAGGGERFQKLPLPRGAPAVGAALVGGGGEAVRERGEVVGHGQSSFLWEGLPGGYNRRGVVGQNKMGTWDSPVFAPFYDIPHPRHNLFMRDARFIGCQRLLNLSAEPCIAGLGLFGRREFRHDGVEVRHHANLSSFCLGAMATPRVEHRHSAAFGETGLLSALGLSKLGACRQLPMLTS